MAETRAKAPEKAWLLIAEAAELLGVSEPTLRRWDASGRFPARRHPVNGYRLYDTAAVIELREAIRGAAR